MGRERDGEEGEVKEEQEEGIMCFIIYHLASQQAAPRTAQNIESVSMAGRVIWKNSLRKEH